VCDDHPTRQRQTVGSGQEALLVGGYEDETIRAFDTNDRPLPLTSGALLRLRVESIHGYTMVNYLHKIEWIEDYSTVGDGMGGTREDSSLQSINAKI
jgi:sulfoxide reductase catalytic subunit YedY